ncbi:toluene-4-monooxygenase system protein D [mine drainage metagenome]
MSNAATNYDNNVVGPILRQGDVAKAVADAAETDNPGKKINISDMVAYIRVQTDGEMTIRRSTIEEMLGRPFKMNDLEINLASFAGRIETDPEYVRFYFVKHL